MKKEINAFDYAGDICKALPKGILMTTKTGDYVNTMVIGWGHVGIEWGRPIFVAYVRESRHTKQMVEECGEFTVNPHYLTWNTVPEENFTFHCPEYFGMLHFT